MIYYFKCLISVWFLRRIINYACPLVRSSYNRLKLNITSIVGHLICFIQDFLAWKHEFKSGMDLLWGRLA